MSHENPKKPLEGERNPSIRVAGFAADSRVNGPGRRVVLWVQGCSIGCRACFNPQTHTDAGPEAPVAEVAARILAARSPESVGLALSGGEPFQQAPALAELCARLRDAWPEASLLAFSGYAIEDLRGPQAPTGAAALLAHLDLLVDGPFDATAPSRRPWRASANQRLWILGRRPPEAALPAPDAVEIQVEPDGQVLLSGFPDPALRRAIRELAR